MKKSSEYFILESFVDINVIFGTSNFDFFFILL